jgi:hypothetical protein
VHGTQNAALGRVVAADATGAPQAFAESGEQGLWKKSIHSNGLGSELAASVTCSSRHCHEKSGRWPGRRVNWP